MSHRSGFTLVEILLVMLITSILVLGIHAAFRQAHALWAQAEDDREIYHLVRVLSETLREELGGLYVPPKSEGEEGQDRGPGFRLSTTRGEGTELSFFTFTPAWRSDVASSRPARVRYRFTGNAEAGRTVLERFETLCATEKVIGTEMLDVVAHDLTDVKVWVFDPNGGPSADSWTDAYESDDRPPKAVKVRLEWNAAGANTAASEPATFESVITIPAEAALVPAAN